jgi:hypothetical protein
MALGSAAAAAPDARSTTAALGSSRLVADEARGAREGPIEDDVLLSAS